MKRIIILLLLFALLASIRLSAPQDLFEGAQRKQVSYVMDILHNGSWLIQYEVNGQIATKPPVYNWIGASFCYLFSTTAPWVMKLPSLLGAAGLLILVYAFSLKLFDPATAFYASLTCVSAYHFSKLMWFARTDMLVTFLLYVAIYLLMFMRSSWWKPVVIGAVMGIGALTKGPVGVGLFCLFLIIWGWREGAFRESAAWLKLALGFVIFAIVAGGWLLAVWNNADFQKVVLHDEMVQHFDPFREGSWRVYFPLLYVLARIAPWPLIAIAAVPAARGRKEWPNVKFLSIWALVFLVTFCLFPTKRHDYVFPVYPVIFILAGIGLKYLVEGRPGKVADWVICGMAVLLAASVLFFSSQANILAIALLIVILASAAGAILMSRKHKMASLTFIAAGLIVASGFYQYWTGPEDRFPYEALQNFAAAAKRKVKDEKLLVFMCNPLVSYELGLHQRDLSPERPALDERAYESELQKRSDWVEHLARMDPAYRAGPRQKSRLIRLLHQRDILLKRIARENPAWLVINLDLADAASETSPVSLKEELRLEMKRDKELRIGLYRIITPAPPPG